MIKREDKIDLINFIERPPQSITPSCRSTIDLQPFIHHSPEGISLLTMGFTTSLSANIIIEVQHETFHETDYISFHGWITCTV